MTYLLFFSLDIFVSSHLWLVFLSTFVSLEVSFIFSGSLFSTTAAQFYLDIQTHLFWA